MTTTYLDLKSIIQNEIAEKGAMPFERFMQLALYHESYGYYLRPEIEIGKRGDFTTASEMSPLYAQCFAHEVKRIFAAIHVKQILELGAGTGLFAGHLLKELQHQKINVQQYYIYEISPTLRDKQKKLLQEHFPDVYPCIIWLTELPKNFNGIIIANEVLDAIPVSCFAYSNNSLYEKMVECKDDHLAFTLQPPRAALAEKTQALLNQYHFSAPYHSEINLQLPQFLQTLSDCLNKGIVLFADYGYGEREYYHPERNRGTLTCFYQHQKNDNPFLHIGEQDITAHVNFTAVISDAHDVNFQLGGFTTQGAFLLNNNLHEYAKHLEKNLNATQQFNLHQAIKRLTFPQEMGERVKVMALYKNVDITFPSFLIHDRRRDL